jgi:ABC-type phosphate transport system permease subunit
LRTSPAMLKGFALGVLAAVILIPIGLEIALQLEEAAERRRVREVEARTGRIQRPAGDLA